MYVRIFLLICMMNSVNNYADSGSLNVTIQSNNKPMPLLVIVLNQNTILNSITPIISNDLQWPIQPAWGFDVHTIHLEHVPSKNHIKEWYKQGYALAVLLSMNSDNTAVEWRIYDTALSTMIAGKKIRQERAMNLLAHSVANQVWKALTGFEGIFGTHVAYCKQVHNKKQVLYDIYSSSLLQDQAHLLVKGGKLLAPRWNNDEGNPRLFYSEITSMNMRLMAIDMHGKRSIVSNFDGLNLLPSFSPDGKRIAYCSSKRGNSQIYTSTFDEQQQHWISTILTDNQGNNISPTICDNGDVIFCSDFETKSPKIYWYHADKGMYEEITQDGSCSSPSYCPVTGHIAYIKLIENTLQLCVFDGKTHRQLTFDDANKDEPSWSPQGDYLVFNAITANSSRIALMHVGRKEYCYLTNAHEHCSYPTWSGYRQKEFFKVT